MLIWGPLRAFVNTVTPQLFPKLFTKETGIYFLEVVKTCVDVFGAYSQNLSKLCWRVKIRYGVRRHGRKQHWESYSFGSSISRNHISRHSPWKAKQRDAPVISAFAMVSLFVYGDHHVSLQGSGARPENQATWRMWVRKRHFLNSRLWTFQRNCFDSEDWRTSAVVMAFFAPNYLLCIRCVVMW